MAGWSAFFLFLMVLKTKIPIIDVGFALISVYSYSFFGGCQNKNSLWGERGDKSGCTAAGFVATIIISTPSHLDVNLV